MSKRVVYMASLSCRLDALADSVSAITKKAKRKSFIRLTRKSRRHSLAMRNLYDKRK